MRNLFGQCLKQTQFAALEFEEIFQFSQECLKQALETELIENGYAVRKQRGFYTTDIMTKRPEQLSIRQFVDLTNYVEEELRRINNL